MLQFNNQYGTQSGERGFNSDNGIFQRDWMNYFYDVIGSDPYAADVGCNTNDNLSGYNRNSLIIWMWTLIAPQIAKNLDLVGPGHKLHINFVSRSLTTDQANSDMYMAQRDQIDTNSARYGHTPHTRHEIDIIYIKKGHDALKYYHNKHAAKEITGISTLLTVDRYHKISVIRGDTGKITIVTTKWEDTMIFKLIGLLPVFFSDIKEVVDKDKTIYTILKAFFDNTPETIFDLMQTTVKGYAETLYKRNIDKIFVCLESEKGKYAQKLEHNINNVKSQIHEYEQSVINRMDELQQYQRELTGYLTAPFVIDPDLRNFLEKSQSIKILALVDSDYGAKIQFTTPVMNWNKKDVEMYFKHTALEHETFFNNPFWFGEIIQKIFIEEEYRLLCTTVVNMPIIHRSNNDRWSTDSSPEGTYGNPHFTEYNCYESSRDAYAKAITSNDYTRGFSIILAATATLVFTDSSVMRRMSGHLKEGGTAYNKKIIQHVASGEIFSMKELREKYSKTTEPTETPVEPEVPTAEPRLIF